MDKREIEEFRKKMRAARERDEGHERDVRRAVEEVNGQGANETPPEIAE